jgi:hypothetical protein
MASHSHKTSSKFTSRFKSYWGSTQTDRLVIFLASFSFWENTLTMPRPIYPSSPPPPYTSMMGLQKRHTCGDSLRPLQVIAFEVFNTSDEHASLRGQNVTLTALVITQQSGHKSPRIVSPWHCATYPQGLLAGHWFSSYS